MLFKSTVDEIELPQARLSLHHDFLAEEKYQKLLANLSEEIAWRQDQMRIANKTIDIPRLQAWYGDFAYSYSGIALQPQAWIEPLLFIKKEIEALGYEFNTMLANLYRNGNDSVGWHADDEKVLGTNALIASYSLGAARLFEIKPKPGFKNSTSANNTQNSVAEKHQVAPQKMHIQLPANSLLIMHPPMQNFWLHQLPKQTHILEPRINLTFRKIQQ